jgi:hypothetical protein
MRELTPCPECQRHLCKDEESCPFCGQALSLSRLPAHALPRSRLSRAATFAFGATLLSATALVSCGETEGNQDGEGGTASGGVSPGGTASGDTASGGTNAGEGPAGSGTVPPYGSPPAEGGESAGGAAGGIGSVDLVAGAPAAGSGGGGGFVGIPK